MDELTKTRQLLSCQLTDAVAEDARAALPIIVAIQRDVNQQLRSAVRTASTSASWADIGDALGVSKQAAYQRFKDSSKVLVKEMKAESRAMKAALRAGDQAKVASSKLRLESLAAELKDASSPLKKDA